MFRFAPLILSLALAPPAVAGGKGDGLFLHERSPEAEQPTPPDAPRITPRQQFIQSNVIETLYHELGHALIDILDLPVYGNEEFAADVFSVILMNRLHDKEEVARLARNVAGAYAEEARRAKLRGQTHDAWDIHGSDMQRYYNLACLFYGADPEGRTDLADALDLPRERARSCRDEFDLANRSWGHVLDQLEAEAPGDSLHIDWTLHDDQLTRFITAEIARLNQVMALPEPLAVSVIPCDEINAYYSIDKREITFCTEYATHMGKLFR
ncbi:MAG: hypothetical protein CSA73_00910 [Rhodobacterales bacterium]|nr:MAG: hypothetical protein CSA73_00910 [Rhodobacterales bacterium]